jgi:hypothetical protein
MIAVPRAVGRAIPYAHLKIGHKGLIYPRH